MTIVPVCHSQRVDIFACAQAGCAVCLEELLRKHAGLVRAVVQEQEMGGIDYADLIQEGCIGLWHAIQHYDLGRGNTFGSYAWVVIRHQVWRARFYADREQDDEAEAWLELAEEIEEDWWRWHLRQALLEVVGKLPARLGRLICLAYGLDGQGWHSLAVIGRRWGISRERVRQLHNDALVLLRLPALSMRLRRECERDSRVAYQQALSLNRAWQRNQRRRR